MHFQIEQRQHYDDEYSKNSFHREPKNKCLRYLTTIILLGALAIFFGIIQLQQKLIREAIKNQDQQPVEIESNPYKEVERKILPDIRKYLLQKRTPKNIKLNKNMVYKELPFCLITANQEALEESLLFQSYSNYDIVVYDQQQNSSQEGAIQLTVLNQLIYETCQINSVVVFNDNLSDTSFLKKLNQIYQTKEVWVTYLQGQSTLDIVSVYSRLLILAQRNNFTGTILNQSTISRGELTVDLISLSLDHLQKLERENNQLGLMYLKFEQIGETLPRYQSLISMKQFSKINKVQYSQNYESMRQNKKDPYRASFRNLNQSQMFSAISYLELLYLPQNHSIADMQRQNFQSKYILSRGNSQKPICVLIPSYNNIQDNRFQRVIDSVLQQQYQNYHIVFIDDQSTDDTLKQTMKLVQKRGFPSSRIKFVQNLQKNFATYNIVNGAFNYCDPQDVLIIQDGDDELVGRQVFRLINYGYRSQETWLMYTTFMTSTFKYGSSRPIPKKLQGPKRQAGHFIGQLRAFSVSLIRHIKLKDHQCLPGEWLETVYDDAIQHPLIEMAQKKHVEFLKEICYYYNVKYGNNDNSEEWKRVYRTNLYQKVILQRTPYKPLQELDKKYEDKEVREALNADYNVRYKDITEQSQIVEVSSEQITSTKCKDYIFKLAKYEPN